MNETYMFENRGKMRRGYTTGTCAAAASTAAAVMLLIRSRVESVAIDTPKGLRLELEVENIQSGEGWVSCGVRKDAGDDPDVTHGLIIHSSVSRDGAYVTEDSGYYEYTEDNVRLRLAGGPGVGRVTKQGLSCPVGKAAINPVPRSMIFREVAAVCRRAGFSGTLWIEIRVPGAWAVAEKTFNARLGITGGISILGTTGIVEPMSQKALLETIRLELRQKVLEGQRTLIMVPGNYGETFLKENLGIETEQAVKCSNYVGEALDMAAEEGVERILLIGHCGKLVKLAAGIMNTHSQAADGRMEILAAHGAACGAGQELSGRILDAVTVDEGLRLLETEGLREPVMKRVMERVYSHLKRRAGGRLEIEALLFTNDRGVLGTTQEAGSMLEYFKGYKYMMGK